MKIDLTENDYYYYKGKIMYVGEHLRLRRDQKRLERINTLEIKVSEKDKYIETLEKAVLKNILNTINNNKLKEAKNE